MQIINATQTIWVPRDFFRKNNYLNEIHHSYRYKFFISIIFCWLSIIVTSAITYQVYSFYGLQGLSLIILPSMFVISVFQYILVHATHECVHQDFKGNNFHSLVSAIITAYPLGLTRNLRTEHLRHHREFGHPVLDPDYDAYWPFPVSRLSFLSRVLSNISGFSAIRQFMGRINNKNNKEKKMLVKKQSEFNNNFEISLVILTQLLILFIFSIFFDPAFYFLLYLIPLITFVKLFNQLRGLAEHGDPQNRPTLRSFNGADIIGRVFGVYGFRHHAAHHLIPAVSSENLEAAHNLIMTCKLQNNDNEHEIQIYEGNHIQLLMAWLIDLPWRAK